MRKNVIITGIPRAGKSTAMYRFIETIEDKLGFVTKEVLVDGVRTGFEIEMCTGERMPFASIDFISETKVSKYGVRTENLERAINLLLGLYDDANHVFYIDEIGQMQLLYNAFAYSIQRMLDEPNAFIGTMSAVFDHPFIEQIKQRNDIILVTVTTENRDGLQEFLAGILKKVEKAKGYVKDQSRFSWEVPGYSIEVRSDHGTRILQRVDKKWLCSCDFFKKWDICSHHIAAEHLGYF